MAIDATGTPTTLGIPKFNTAVDAPSGKGGNAQMDAIDALLQLGVSKPSGIATGEVPVWNGTTWVRSSVTNVGPASLGSGTPDATKFLRGDGSWQIGNLIGVRYITATGTYTPTAGTRAVYVEAVGGGAGGGGAAATAAGQGACAGGGGGGGYSASLLTSGFSGVTATIGAGGNGGTAGNNAGNAGGDTSFGAVVVAKGGAAGNGSANFAVTAGLGAGPGFGGQAASGTGDIKINGGGGTYGIVLGTNQQSIAGLGGGTFFSAATPLAAASSSAQAGNPGNGYGAGGGGGASAGGGGAVAGGNGAAGLIRVWEFA